MIVQFSAQIDSAKANNDRTLTIKLDTQELSTEDTANIFSFFQKQVWIAIAETVLTKQDLNIPETIDEMDKKSPSQRLRDRMYVYWNENKIPAPFDNWYKAQLEKLGQNYLDKVN